MRGLVETFLRTYPDIEVGEGLPINVLCLSEQGVESYDHYIATMVQPMGEEAQSAVLYVLPIVLRINLRIIILDHNIVYIYIYIYISYIGRKIF